MISRAPIEPNRIRKITGSFSWLDHRLLHDGHLAAMTPQEILLYFFLVLVGDRNGISFYSYEKICTFLKLDLQHFIEARDRLVGKSLIATQSGRFQVLQLPEKPPDTDARTTGTARKSSPKSLAEIFAEIAQRKNSA